jgi:hypothetical protein
MHNRLKIKKSTLLKLYMYTLLVYSEYRNAYLVDCCLLDKVQIELFIINCNNIFNLDCFVLKVIDLGDNIIIVK